jgi:hypothetical protein
MNNELTKIDARELHELAENINKREAVIEELKQSTLKAADGTLAEAILQGQDLIKCRSIVPHGQWDNWLAAHCPTICRRSGYLYMSLAKNVQRVAQMGSIRSALALLKEHNETSTKSEDDQWPAYHHILHAISKLIGRFEHLKKDDWPSEAQTEARNRMLPIFKGLFPEVFAALPMSITNSLDTSNGQNLPRPH